MYISPVATAASQLSSKPYGQAAVVQQPPYTAEFMPPDAPRMAAWFFCLTLAALILVVGIVAVIVVVVILASRPVTPPPPPPPTPPPPPPSGEGVLDELARIVIEDPNDVILAVSQQHGENYPDFFSLALFGGQDTAAAALATFTDEQIDAPGGVVQFGTNVTRNYIERHTELMLDLYVNHTNRPLGGLAATHVFRNPEGVDIAVIGAGNGHIFIHVHNFLSFAAAVDSANGDKRYLWEEVAGNASIVLAFIPSTWNVWREYAYKLGYVYAVQETGLVSIGIEAISVLEAANIHAVSDKRLTSTRWGLHVYSLPIRGAQYITADPLSGRNFIYVSGVTVHDINRTNNLLVGPTDQHPVTFTCPEESGPLSISSNSNGDPRATIVVPGGQAAPHLNARPLIAFQIFDEPVASTVTFAANIPLTKPTLLGPDPGPPITVQPARTLPNVVHAGHFTRTYIAGMTPVRHVLDSGVLDVLWVTGIYNSVFYSINVTNVLLIGEVSSILQATCLPDDGKSYRPRSIAVSSDRSVAYVTSEEIRHPIFFYNIEDLEPASGYPLLRQFFPNGGGAADRTIVHECRHQAAQPSVLESGATVDRLWCSMYSEGSLLMEIDEVNSTAADAVPAARIDTTTRRQEDGTTIDGCSDNGEFCGTWGLFPVEGNDGLAVSSNMSPFGNATADETEVGVEEAAIVFLKAVSAA